MYCLVKTGVLNRNAIPLQAVVAGIAYDRKQPGTPAAAAKTCKVADGAKIRFLNRILRLGFIAHQPASKVVRRIQVFHERCQVTSVPSRFAWDFPGCRLQVLRHDFLLPIGLRKAILRVAAGSFNAQPTFPVSGILHSVSH